MSHGASLGSQLSPLAVYMGVREIIHASFEDEEGDHGPTVDPVVKAMAERDLHAHYAD